MTQVWLTEEDAKHWEPQPLVVKYIRSLIRPTDRVLELAPATSPSRAPTCSSIGRRRPRFPPTASPSAT
jgi:hypothetical protein